MEAIWTTLHSHDFVMLADSHSQLAPDSRVAGLLQSLKSTSFSPALKASPALTPMLIFTPISSNELSQIAKILITHFLLSLCSNKSSLFIFSLGPVTLVVVAG